MTFTTIFFVGVFVAGMMATRAQASEEKQAYKIVCYLGSWANYRNGNGKFVIEDIDPFMCTHLIYGFAKLDNNQIKPYDPYLDLKENWGLGAYQRFNGLKKNNPRLKTLIAIGGWNEGSVKYSKMSSEPQSRKVFVESCLQFLRKYGFDGVDMDWEYPTQRGGSPSDKKNFVLLLKELKDAFKPYGYLLTAAVSAGQNTIDSAYDVPEIVRHLDFINLMAYDFHGGWDSRTGHNSPLYSRPDESDDEKKLNTDYAVKYWIRKGAPPKKLILGMALYGRTFTLQNPQEHGLGARITGKGNAGPYTRENGFLGYNEICESVNPKNGWTVVFDEHHKVPYAFKDRQWVGYDNEKSIALKVNFIKKMNLGGGMVWSIETDDFKGLCNNARYPLLNTIKSGLSDGRQDGRGTGKPSPRSDGDLLPTTTNLVQSTNTQTDGSTSQKESDQSETEPNYSIEETTSTPKKTPKPHELCQDEGYFRDPADCKKFFYCMRYEPAGFISYQYNCGPGTVFSQTMQTCAFPSQVPECDK